MMLRRISIKSFVCSAAILGSLVAAPIALASSFEWLSDFLLEGNAANGMLQYNPGLPPKLTYTVNTNGDYYEYRSSYYGLGDYAPTTTEGWTEWTDCRVEGDISTSTIDICYPNPPQVSATSTIWIRSTTNYNGCGSYTPTPGENCGDFAQTSSTVIP